MALRKSSIWQHSLYIVRFLSIIALIPIHVTSVLIDPFDLYGPHHEPFDIFFLSVLGACLLNDLVLLFWDVWFYGSIISTAILQTIHSLFVTIVLSITLARYTLWVFSEFYFLAILSSAMLVISTVHTCYHGPSRMWKLGVKQLAYHGSESARLLDSSVFFFGIRRSREDEISLIWSWLWKSLLSLLLRGLKSVRRFPHSLRTMLKLSIMRRTKVETLHYALWRNITAVILVLLLVGRSVQLFYGVIYEKFSIQETWDELEFDMNTMFPCLCYEGDSSNDPWTIAMLVQDSIAPLSYILQQNSSDRFFDTDLNLVQNCPGNGFEYFTWNSSTQVFNIATVLQSGMAFSEPGNMWLSLLIANYYAPNYSAVTSALLQYSKPFQLNAGTMKTGFLEISMRREIDPSFLGMVGLIPSYYVIPLISIRWTSEVPLANASIAQATLMWDQNSIGQHDGIPMRYRVITDFRQHTFIDALSSIGGLLATLQGLHILVFGRPLWWGFFGSKLLNPFGIFGASSSKDVRDQMISRYGYIPSSSAIDCKAVRSLGLFLNDFVMDFGPLYKHDEDIRGESVRDFEEHDARYSPDSRCLNISVERDVDLGDMETLGTDWSMTVGDGSASNIPLMRC